MRKLVALIVLSLLLFPVSFAGGYQGRLIEDPPFLKENPPFPDYVSGHGTMARYADDTDTDWDAKY